MRCELDIPHPFDLVWDRLRDLNAVAAGLPGATIDLVAAERVHGRITVRFRGTSVTYRGTLGIAETGPGTVLLTANAAQVRGVGSVDGTVRIRVGTRGDATRVEVIGRAVVSGRAAELPEDILRQTVRRLVENAADRFATALATPSTDAPAADDAVGDAPAAASPRRTTAPAEEPPATTPAAAAQPVAAAPASGPGGEPDAVSPAGASADSAPATALPLVQVARTSAELVPVARRARPRRGRALWWVAAAATVAAVGAARGAGRSRGARLVTRPGRGR